MLLAFKLFWLWKRLGQEWIRTTEGVKPADEVEEVQISLRTIRFAGEKLKEQERQSVGYPGRKRFLPHCSGRPQRRASIAGNGILQGLCKNCVKIA